MGAKYINQWLHQRHDEGLNGDFDQQLMLKVQSRSNRGAGHLKSPRTEN